jgi:hypothetical protein
VGLLRFDHWKSGKKNTVQPCAPGHGGCLPPGDCPPRSIYREPSLAPPDRGLVLARIVPSGLAQHSRGTPAAWPRSRACVASCDIPQTISVVPRDPGVSVCSADFSLYLEAISSAFCERKQVCFALELVHSFRNSAQFSNFSATVCFGAEVVQIWWPVLWR